MPHWCCMLPESFGLRFRSQFIVSLSFFICSWQSPATVHWYLSLEWCLYDPLGNDVCSGCFWVWLQDGRCSGFLLTFIWVFPWAVCIWVAYSVCSLDAILALCSDYIFLDLGCLGDADLCLSSACSMVYVVGSWVLIAHLVLEFFVGYLVDQWTCQCLGCSYGFYAHLLPSLYASWALVARAY